jgi:UDP-N-acetylmuramyl pentapeptide phosphotransferase/UDP-N-acetylglucosamine-1-phosphate transferase
MFIGMVIGSLTILGDYSKYNDVAFISGFLILSIPIFDMVYVMFLRIIHKKSPFFGSPDHFTLRLKQKFKLTSAKTVGIVFILQMVLTAVVILNYFSNPTITILSTLGIVIFFVWMGLWLSDEKMI